MILLNYFSRVVDLVSQFLCFNVCQPNFISLGRQLLLEIMSKLLLPLEFLLLQLLLTPKLPMLLLLLPLKFLNKLLLLPGVFCSYFVHFCFIPGCFRGTSHLYLLCMPQDGLEL